MCFRNMSLFFQEVENHESWWYPLQHPNYLVCSFYSKKNQTYFQGLKDDLGEFIC